MNEKELKQFLLAQIEEINRYKWLESEKQNQDIGFQKAASEWIHQYSQKFKNYYCNTKHKNSKKPMKKTINP